MVCSKANLVSISADIGWVDAGATTHISISMHGCLWSQLLIDVERFIYMNDDKTILIEAIGNFILKALQFSFQTLL